MSTNEMNELQALRLENARLKALSASTISVQASEGKDGKVWIAVKGIPGTGWGMSATAAGWEVFAKNWEAIKPQVEAKMNEQVAPRAKRALG